MVSLRVRLPVLAVAVGTAMSLAACTTGGGSAGTSTTAGATAQASSSAGAGGLQASYIKVVDKVRPSVVEITTSSGLGSGIVYDNKGDIVTNDHVVAGANKVTVQFISGAKAAGTVTGTFAADDLAVVRVAGVSAKDLHPAAFANSTKLQVGDIVLAIGNPLAYSSSVTDGIVSAVGRTVVEPKSASSPGGVITNAVQTSAAINPGNSGGALVDLSGAVVGIPTVAAEDPQIGGAAVGIGFAIPSNTATNIAGQIIRDGHVVNSHRADLGVYAYQATNTSGNPIGVAIERLTSDSPAGKAGIKAGDVIVGINGTTVTTESQLQGALAQLKPGQSVPVKILRQDGTTTTVKVTLGTLPGNTG